MRMLQMVPTLGQILSYNILGTYRHFQQWLSLLLREWESCITHVKWPPVAICEVNMKVM
jgi:hypothetical protein